MTQGLSAPRPAEAVREVRRDLVEARDDQLLKVVRIMDSMGDRGAGDAVLAPVRARLKVLHPPRPLRLARILFLPFDPLIIDPAKWRPGGPHLPRTALAPLSELVRDTVDPAALARVDSLIGSGRVSVSSPGEAGLLVWSLAAKSLCAALRAPPPPAWMAAGLPASEFLPVVSGLAPVLLAEPRLRAWEARRWLAADETALAGLLRETMAVGARAWGMMLALFLLRFPHSAAPLEAALAAGAQPPGPMRDAGEAALRMVLDRVDGDDPAPSANAAGAAGAIAQMADLLDGLASRLPDQARRQRAIQARTRLHQGCLQSFKTSLEKNLMAPLGNLASGAASDSAIEEMEGAARRMRQFECEARRLGGGANYDSMLGDVTARLAGIAGLEAMDRARLTEILLGPAAACRSLQV